MCCLLVWKTLWSCFFHFIKFKIESQAPSSLNWKLSTWYGLEIIPAVFHTLPKVQGQNLFVRICLRLQSQIIHSDMSHWLSMSLKRIWFSLWIWNEPSKMGYSSILNASKRGFQINNCVFPVIYVLRGIYVWNTNQ